eukprot:XP_764433.1 hypothetical protein [Theileria parva strain Muguga]
MLLQLVDRLDVGDPRSLELKLSDTNWSCEKIVVYKGSRFWTFDCIPSKSRNKDEHVTTYLLSGNKTYTVSVQTGGQKDAGSNGTISLALLGSSGKTNEKTLSNAFYPASYQTFQVKGADVGDINGLIISNDAVNDPWYCDSIRIASNEVVNSFPVKRWVGYPFESSVEISTESLTSVTNLNETSPLDVMCNTRAVDIYSGTFVKPFNITVRCPMNCNNDPLMSIEGSSLHPSSTSICGAAIYDGATSPSGGQVVISIVQSMAKYFGGTGYNGLKSEDYEPPADKNNFSFFMFLDESIDDIDKNVRLVDGFGKLTSFGRLELFRNGKWGTVCKRGKHSIFNNQSATFVCNSLGFKYGINIEENCTNVNNQNFCAPPGYNVSCSGLKCKGDETDINNCTLEEPTIDCKNHKEDVVVKCSNFSPTTSLEYGTLRIVDSTGATSSTGTGRLEIYNNGFGTVCNEYWTKEAEKIACTEMGYSGLRNGGVSDKECSNFNGLNLCAQVHTKIAANNFKCNGGESKLTDCEHESGDDIYCTHDQDVIVSCIGNGDPSEFRNLKKVEPFVPPLKKLSKVINLSCYDTLTSHSEFQGEFGSFKVASCPMGCMDEPASIKGTYVYTRDSSICKAAIHSGVLDNSGGEIVVIIAYPQEHFYGTSMNGVESLSLSRSGDDSREKAFMVSRPTKYVMSKVEKEVLETSKTNGEFLNILWNLEEKPMTPSYVMAPYKFFWSPDPSWKGGVGNWSTIFSFQSCGGLLCSIDNFGELVLQENCKPELVKTSYFPTMGKRAHISILYYVLTKDISVFVDGVPVTNQLTSLDLNFQGDLILGKMADTDSDYFKGHILAFQAYDYVMSPEQIRQQFASSQNSENLTSHLTKVRLTTEGNVCLSKCMKKFSGKYDVHSNATNPAIKLGCSDTIESENFNGPNGKSFLISCTKSCIDPDLTLKGTKVYTSDSSICKAALHSGVIPKDGGEAILTVLNGLSEYGNCHGHFGHFHFTGRLNLYTFLVKVYSPTSSLCQAAIHSGNLDNDGGEVEIEVDGKRDTFDSNESNGILSQSSGQYLKSFKIIKVRKRNE